MFRKKPTAEEYSFNKTLDWFAHEHIAKHVVTIVTTIHLLRTNAKSKPSLNNIRDWFEEVNSLYSLVKPITNNPNVRLSEFLVIKFYEIYDVCLNKKPTKRIVDRLVKIVELFQDTVYTQMQNFNYFFKMEHVKRTPDLQVDQYIKEIYGEDSETQNSEVSD